MLNKLGRKRMVIVVGKRKPEEKATVSMSEMVPMSDIELDETLGRGLTREASARLFKEQNPHLFE